MNDYAIVFSGGGALGAWEVGCYKAILSRYKNQPPSIVTGASAGAINAAGVCAGLTPGTLEKLWKELKPEKVYSKKLDENASQVIVKALLGRTVTNQIQDIANKYNSIYSTEPLEKTFEDIFSDNYPTFRQSRIKCAFSLTNLTTSRPTFFFNSPSRPHDNSSSDWIKIDSSRMLIQGLMGTTALPLLFPPFAGQYFDGGVLMNQPITPAIKLGAKIIYVLIPKAEGLSPATSLVNIAETLCETWIGTSLMSQLEIIKVTNDISNHMNQEGIAICVIRPQEDLGSKYGVNLLAFGEKVRELISDGNSSANYKLNQFDSNNSLTWY